MISLLVPRGIGILWFLSDIPLKFADTRTHTDSEEIYTFWDFANRSIVFYMVAHICWLPASYGIRVRKIVLDYGNQEEDEDDENDVGLVEEETTKGIRNVEGRRISQSSTCQPSWKWSERMKKRRR